VLSIQIGGLGRVASSGQVLRLRPWVHTGLVGTSCSGVTWDASGVVGHMSRS